MSLFDLKSLEKFLKAHLHKVETIKQLIGDLPQAGDIYCLWTLNSFNAFTFIPFMIKEHGVIHDLIISTYSISTRILHSMINYIDKGMIENVHITISDSVKFRLPKVNEQLVSLNNRDNFNVNYTWNHSKVTLIRTPVGYYVVEGSGNYAENAQFEQYIFLSSEPIYNFRKNCIIEP
ncbi:MAG: hypothetical protein ACOYMF_05205 [Bacteroidales bacterium]